MTVLAPEMSWSFALFESASARLVDPDGAQHEGLTASLEGLPEHIEVVWPKGSLLNKPGLWQVLVGLTAEDGKIEHFPPYGIPVEQHDGWHTIDSIRDVWREAPLDDAELFTYLDAAKDLCIAKADPITGPVPQRYRLAQAMQVRAMWNAGHVSSGGQYGSDDQAVYAYSMGYDIVKLLRPSGAIGGMF
ncbi:hypothetical protein [Curtobacterium sp. MCBA15_008]|uniref:hypothetical protein n=1 Tax=Curtobacterium sp. MCBA15_008 TaxID=1898736 RepID=UPI0015874A19|nr:hypothetical protein [Curtobacterium sp. MCBA15_008]